MNELHFDGNTFFVSREVVQERGLDYLKPAIIRFVFKWICRVLMRRRLFGEAVAAHERRTGLRGMIVIEAHGGRRRRRRDGRRMWVYKDDDGPKSMQRWINAYDGKAVVLLLFCCNRHRFIIQSRQSIVIHANAAISIQRGARGRVPLRFYFPGIGYIEDNYYQLHKVIDG